MLMGDSKHCTLARCCWLSSKEMAECGIVELLVEQTEAQKSHRQLRLSGVVLEPSKPLFQRVLREFAGAGYRTATVPAAKI